MDTKHLSGVIPLDLHQRASEEIRATESTMSKYLEMVIREHYEKGANKNMKTRTLAFQVSEELFQRIDEYLERYEDTYHRRLTKRGFVVGQIEQALEEAEEELEAAEAAKQEERAEEAEDQDDEVDEAEVLDTESGGEFTEDPDECPDEDSAASEQEEIAEEASEPAYAS